jgi:hypothetical protein
MGGLELMRLVAAIIMVESSGNDNAVNHREQAYGPLQVRQAVLTDVNRAYKTNYVLSQMRNRATAKEVFTKYVRLYGADTSQEAAARCWNAGPGWKVKTGTAKQNVNVYWQKVKAQLQKDNANATLRRPQSKPTG